jgi:hypothetical protein
MAEVVYELSLKDGLTQKLHQADGAAHKLEGTMGSLGDRLIRVAEGFGVSFGLWKGLEFIQQGKEEFEKLEIAQGQVEAGLESTGHAAGVTGEQLEASAAKFSHALQFNRDQVADLQAQIITFPGITAKVFDSATMSIMDMATRLHHGLDETAIMVGKALQDPERGITAMRRVGVNFNDTQTEIIKNLVKTGQAGKAQALILQELQTEFAGSAQAAANSDPLFRYNKLMYDIKIQAGGVAIKLLKFVTPALEGMMNAVKGTIHWMREHKQLLIDIAYVVGPLVATFSIYAIGVGVAAAATSVWTGALSLLKLALNTNPIGLMISAIAAVSLAVWYCYKHFDTFRATLWATWAVIKEFASIVGDIFKGLYKTIHGTFTLNPMEVADGLMLSIDAVKDAGQRLGKAAKDGYNAGLSDFAADAKSSATTAAPHDVMKKGKPVAAAGAPAKGETKGAKGNKAVTINIKIDALQKGDIKIITTNIKEAPGKIQEMITQSLMNAVNNSQLIIEN